MFCEMLSGMSGCGKCLFALLCCIFCCGPILIIIGIAVLASDNGRVEDVTSYNDAVKAYASGDSKTLAHTVMFVNTLRLQRSAVAIDVVGNQEGVLPAEHFVFSRSNVAIPSDDLYNLDVSLDANETIASTLTFDLPFAKTVTRQMRCTLEYCTSDCESSSSYRCNMEAICNSVFGGVYTENDGSCNAQDTCGTCRYTGQLASACLVVHLESDNTVSQSAKYRSCHFPFTEHDYAAASSTVSVSVVSDKDPYIALQELTDGSDDFGLTEDQQRSAGLALLISGIVITVICGCLMCWWMYSRNQEQQRQRLAQEQVMQAQQCDGVPVYGQSQTNSQEPFYPPQNNHVTYGQPAQGGYSNGNAAYNNNYNNSPAYSQQYPQSQQQQQQQQYQYPPPQGQQYGRNKI
jgi:hypothetical protein